MRPYRNWTIGELEILFDSNRDDYSVCEYVAMELKLRKQTHRVAELHRRVVQRISVGFRERVETSSESEVEENRKACQKPESAGIFMRFWYLLLRLLSWKS